MYSPGLRHALLILAAAVLLLVVVFSGQFLFPGIGSGLPAGGICAAGKEGNGCWQVLDSSPDCYLWNNNLEVNSTVTWSGACAGGLAEGDGEIKWVSGQDRENISTYTGHLRQGRMEGQWSVVVADGSQGEGPFVDGKQHGHWVFRQPDGTVVEGSFVNGRYHGQWVVHEADGAVGEGPFVDGKRHGQWVLRTTYNAVFEGPYVVGKREGQWVERYPFGFVHEGPYVGGRRHGEWVVRWANVKVTTISWLDGIPVWVDM